MTDGGSEARQKIYEAALQAAEGGRSGLADGARTRRGPRTARSRRAGSPVPRRADSPPGDARAVAETTAARAAGVAGTWEALAAFGRFLRAYRAPTAPAPAGATPLEEALCAPADAFSVSDVEYWHASDGAHVRLRTDAWVRLAKHCHAQTAALQNLRVRLHEAAAAAHTGATLAALRDDVIALQCTHANLLADAKSAEISLSQKRADHRQILTSAVLSLKDSLQRRSHALDAALEVARKALEITPALNEYIVVSPGTDFPSGTWSTAVVTPRPDLEIAELVRQAQEVHTCILATHLETCAMRLYWRSHGEPALKALTAAPLASTPGPLLTFPTTHGFNLTYNVNTGGVGACRETEAPAPITPTPNCIPTRTWVTYLDDTIHTLSVAPGGLLLHTPATAHAALVAVPESILERALAELADAPEPTQVLAQRALPYAPETDATTRAFLTRVACI